MLGTISPFEKNHNYFHFLVVNDDALLMCMCTWYLQMDSMKTKGQEFDIIWLGKKKGNIS
jgi:hypothetical protein